MASDLEFIDHRGNPGVNMIFVGMHEKASLHKHLLHMNISNADDYQSASLSITRDDAIRLRDWLNAWLEETK